MVRKSELLPEMRIVKAERKLDLLFLAIVNIADQRSHLFLAGEAMALNIIHTFVKLDELKKTKID